MPRLLALLTAGAVATGLTACGSSGSDATSSAAAPASAATSAAPPASTAAPATTTPAQPTGDCAPAPDAGGKKALPCPKPSLIKGKANVVVMRTSQGTFEITLDVKRAPATSNSFASLTKLGFFDGLDFHRVVKGFVIQGGDPDGDGSGGPGYTVTEAPPADLTYTKGVVAMAKSGAEPSGASGSQFFVVTGDAGLPPEYALLGKVTKGLSTVERIDALGTGGDGPPRKKVTIESAKLVGR